MLGAVVGCGERGIGGERYFRVDDNVAVVRIADNDIGLHALTALFVDEYFARFVFDELLAEVVFAFDEAGRLQDAFKNHLSPISLLFRVAFQCACQVVRFFAEAVVQFAQFFDVFAQRVAFFGFGGVGLFHLFAKLFDVFIEWTQ